MTRIAFFAHDAGDAAVRRRVQGFVDDGLDVTGFMMRRGEDAARSWVNIDLGRTHDAAYAQRVKAIFAGADRAAANRDQLAAADIIYARNLDMLATAFLARRKARLDTPIIYESLDVHRLLTRQDLVGVVFRRLEGALLSRTRRLVVSSPGFIENHFARRHPGRYQASLIENRLAAGADYGERPPVHDVSSSADKPLVIGWVGVLRCSRSLDLLTALAHRFGERISIQMHGAPALTEVPDFHERIAGVRNITFHGRYRAPEDLAAIYGGLDLVWAGDFMEAGYNSVWLLPNRLYEGGYYGVPPIAPSGTQTAKWIDSYSAGFCVAEDLSQTLPALIERLLADRAPISQRSANLLSLPDTVFVQPRGELRSLIEDALNSGPDTSRSSSPTPASPARSTAR